jgi:hypothetical protein
MTSTDIGEETSTATVGNSLQIGAEEQNTVILHGKQQQAL